VAIKAIYHRLKYLKGGGVLEAPHDRQASDLLRAVNRTDEFMRQQREYRPTQPQRQQRRIGSLFASKDSIG
jgi:hypothetical protein